MLRKYISALLLAIFLFATISLPLRRVNAYASYISDKPVIVSLGDSYSSGEGNTPYYQELSYSERSGQNDWLCHRSPDAWPALLTYDYNGNRKQVEYMHNNGWYFAASSGAKTKHVAEEEQEITFCRQALGLIRHRDVPAQLSVFEENNLYGQVDFVTITIGGNDIGFGKILTDAVIDCRLTYLNNSWSWTSNVNFLTPHYLEDRLSEAWESFTDEARDSIRNTYRAIYNAAGRQATIIVAGYPPLLSETNDSDFFTAEEGVLVNSNVRLFNDELENIVNELQAEGIDIVFVDVYDSFAGHEAYSDEPYINGIILTQDNPSDINKHFSHPLSSYSIHPNRAGQEAYAACVQEVFDAKWEEKLNRRYAFTEYRRDIITLGSYEQDGYVANGTEPLEWVVLMRDEERALLISRTNIDVSSSVTTTAIDDWENSELRAYLNDAFITDSFLPTEIDAIRNDNTDQVFFLDEFEYNLFSTYESLDSYNSSTVEGVRPSMWVDASVLNQ